MLELIKKEVICLTKEKIREKLFSMQDLKYREFSAALVPTVDKSTVIGVRIPLVKALAKELVSKAYADNDFCEINEFLSNVPHEFLEENNLHAFIVSNIKSFQDCINRVEDFLPFVNNWSTCDSFRPACFKRERKKLMPYIKKWIQSDMPYTVRFAVEMLMVYYLDEDFSVEYPDTVSKIRSDEYYVNMMIAWYFATALAKQYECVIPYLERKELPPWVHNKTIQKACESYRITAEQKSHIRTLKLKICK